MAVAQAHSNRSGTRPTAAFVVSFLSVVLVAGASLVLASCSAEDSTAIRGSGTIEATEVTVSAQTAGELLELNVRRGDTVERGTVLARVDPVDLEFQLSQARYRLEAAQAERDGLLAGAREEDIRGAEAGLTEARAAMTLAERTLERVRNLHAAGSTTDSELDRVETQYSQARARVDAAEAQLQRLESLVRPEERRRAQAVVSEAETAVARAERQLAHAVISAPRDGTVTVVVREAGEIVSPGTPVVVVADLSTVYLTIYVSERRLGEVKLGAEATVRVDGMPDTRFAGSVSRIAEQAEFTPRNVQTEDARAQLVYAVEIVLDNSDGVFKIGMPATATIAP
ncbi:MAG: efflux RND transporter periplasmic adaptor subunit [Alkalispirochaeta sp.]